MTERLMDLPTLRGFSRLRKRSEGWGSCRPAGIRAGGRSVRLPALSGPCSRNEACPPSRAKRLVLDGAALGGPQRYTTNPSTRSTKYWSSCTEPTAATRVARTEQVPTTCISEGRPSVSTTERVLHLRTPCSKPPLVAVEASTLTPAPSRSDNVGPLTPQAGGMDDHCAERGPALRGCGSLRTSTACL